MEYQQKKFRSLPSFYMAFYYGWNKNEIPTEKVQIKFEPEPHLRIKMEYRQNRFRLSLNQSLTSY